MLITLDFWAVLAEWPLLLKGIAWTLGLTAVSAVLGLIVGIACAWARNDGPPWLGWPAAAYVELLRNTPFIVQLFFIFFGLPAIGVRLSPEVASIIAMAVNLGAYAGEIVRAGIASTPRGQIEAGLSLALSRVQTFRHVLLPQALRKVWPSLVSQMIIVMLGSAVCGHISTEDRQHPRAAQILWRERGVQGHRRVSDAQRGHRPHQQERHGQEHLAALRQRAGNLPG
ncbi:MAG: amino acid ABC transporter permease [Burkholderiaceae bacterium]|nr:amino acid ABC transporter permease [Burkholderiaceae bacterium]